MALAAGDRLGWLPTALAPALTFCVVAPVAAVYAVAAYGGDPGVTWPSFVAAAFGFGQAAGVLVAITPSSAPDQPTGFAGFMGGLATVVLVLPLLASWVAGVRVPAATSAGT